MSCEYAIGLYRGKMDLCKGIDGLCGILREEIGLKPRESKSMYFFSSQTHGLLFGLEIPRHDATCHL